MSLRFHNEGAMQVHQTGTIFGAIETSLLVALQVHGVAGEER